MKPFIVNKVLVLIIGINQFENESLSQLDVGPHIEKLTKLWQDTYNYAVFICNKDTLYSTKKDVIKFIDKYKKELFNPSYTYNGVIVHIITHGTQYDQFVTSDMKKMPIDFIEHEIITESEFEKNTSLIKLVFYHSCRGNENHREIEDDINKKRSEDVKDDIQYDKHNTSGYSAYSNFATIYGTIKDRTVSDKGDFTTCICNAFEMNVKNVNKVCCCKLKKKCFHELITQIGNELEEITKKAEILDDKGLARLRYNTIRFEICKNKHIDEKEEKTKRCCKMSC